MNNNEVAQDTVCEQYLFNGTRCGRPAVTTVALDFTDERKPVCRRHAAQDEERQS
jgi:hypothetical protein